MAETLQLDNLDRGILNALLNNARTAYAELAKQFNVSPGTIHVRVEKMRQAGIIKGTRVEIDPRQLGYDVCCFIGIILKSARDYPAALAKLEALDEVVEAYRCVAAGAYQQDPDHRRNPVHRNADLPAKPDHAYDQALICA